MKVRSMHPIVLSLIVLGLFGFASNLIFNPISMLRQIAIMAVVVGVIYLLYKWYTGKQLGNGFSNQSYMKAVKQSKRTNNDRSMQRSTSFNMKTASKSAKPISKISNVKSKPTTGQPKPTSVKSKITSLKNKTINTKKKSDVQLTVIEGKKGKKKNRAFF